MMESERWQRWRARGAVLGGVFIHLTLGNLYSFGNLTTYMTSYLRAVVSVDTVYSDVVWVLAVTIVAQGLFMPLAGLFEKRLGPRLTCAIGSFIMSLGVGLTRYAVEASVGAVVITYGFLVGLGISLAYVSPLACAMKWYPDRKGLINGLIVAGFGLGALGSTTFQTHYLNPNNVSVAESGYFEDKSVLSRVPGVFTAMALIFAALQAVGCLLLCHPPASACPASPADERADLLNHQSDSDCPEYLENSQTNLTPRAMLRTKLFYHLWSIYLMNTIAISYINATYKSFGQTFLKDDYLLATVGALAAIFNAVGRIVWGRLMDYTSFRTSMCCLTVSLSVLFGALPLVPLTSYPSVAFAACVWFIFFTFCGTFVLMPTVAEKAFGSRHYTSNYGLFFTSQVVSGILVASINQLLLRTIGYAGCFIGVALLAASCFVLTFFLPHHL
ncbi:Major facilitator superfamily [Trinorchestia longiramus]|nr:Major facilitator superfamily [Trinorchestia longiramus]